MEEKVSIRINLSQSEVEIQGSTSFIENVHPTLENLISLLKDYMPHDSSHQDQSMLPMTSSLRPNTTSSFLENEHSEVYENQIPTTLGLMQKNPTLKNVKITRKGIDSHREMGKELTYREKLFLTVVKEGEGKISNVDVVLLAGFILQDDSKSESFKTKDVSSLLKKISYDISNTSHFIKLNCEYNKIYKVKDSYSLTKEGLNHLQYAVGTFIEIAQNKLLS